MKEVFIMLEINSYKKINDDSIGTVRQLFNEASKKQLNLIAFALQENTKKAAQKDLQVEFSPTIASKILQVYISDPKKFITMLQSGLNHLIIEKEQKKQAETQDKSQPYVGQILKCSFGYDCTLVSFYQVVKVTKCFIWVKEIEKQTTEDLDGYNQVTMCRPIKGSFDKDSKPQRRKIYKDKYSGYVISIDGYSLAKPWNGKDTYEDTCD